MFTGIIEATGTVISRDPHPESPEDGVSRFSIHAGHIVHDLPLGGSLAVDGVCLTSVRPSPQGSEGADVAYPEGLFVADVMGETLQRTTLGTVKPGDIVNLERCLPMTGRLDGHIVQGHVDCTAPILARTRHAAWETVRIGLSPDVAPLVAEKGSLAIDGISLTVTAVSAAQDQKPWFEVGLIPATLAATGMGHKQVGMRVNVEVDVMAKYAARLAQFSVVSPSGLVCEGEK